MKTGDTAGQVEMVTVDEEAKPGVCIVFTSVYLLSLG